MENPSRVKKNHFSAFMSGWTEMEVDDTLLGLMSVCMYLSVYIEEKDVILSMFGKTEKDMDGTIMEREMKMALVLLTE